MGMTSAGLGGLSHGGKGAIAGALLGFGGPEIVKSVPFTSGAATGFFQLGRATKSLGNLLVRYREEPGAQPVQHGDHDLAPHLTQNQAERNSQSAAADNVHGAPYAFSGLDIPGRVFPSASILQSPGGAVLPRPMALLPEPAEPIVEPIPVPAEPIVQPAETLAPTPVRLRRER